MRIVQSQCSLLSELVSDKLAATCTLCMRTIHSPRALTIRTHVINSVKNYLHHLIKIYCRSVHSELPDFPGADCDLEGARQPEGGIAGRTGQSEEWLQGKWGMINEAGRDKTKRNSGPDREAAQGGQRGKGQAYVCQLRVHSRVQGWVSLFEYVFHDHSRKSATSALFINLFFQRWWIMQ